MENKEGKIILLTGVSGSGKTTIQEKLIKEYGWTRPLNFTTRKPRTEKAIQELKENKEDWNKLEEEELLEGFEATELDEYIYLTKEQFFKKVMNGDLAEFMGPYSGGHFYGVSNFIDYSRNNLIILDPIGVASLKKKLLLEGKKFVSVYLNIDEKEQEYRLGTLRRESTTSIADRRKDFKYFPHYKYDVYLNGMDSIEENVKKIISLTK